jgi:hypothetical protein
VEQGSVRKKEKSTAAVRTINSAVLVMKLMWPGPESGKEKGFVVGAAEKARRGAAFSYIGTRAFKISTGLNSLHLTWPFSVGFTDIPTSPAPTLNVPLSSH